MKKQITLFTLCLIAILVSVSACSAADIYVNASAPSGGTGTITNPYQTIGDGVDAANNGDTVNIADGTYIGTGNNQINITNAITIQGQSQAGTIINGTGHWIFQNNAMGTIIQKLTLINSGNNPYNYVGGAVYNNYGGNVTVNDCTFKYNNATSGGGIGNDGDMTVNRCTFINNTASNVGGAIYQCDGRITITGCTFINNTANYGGAFGTDYGLLATSIVNNCIFDSNHADNDDGGAIYNCDDITITGCNFNKNTASNRGGAICCLYGDLTVKYSRFVGNNATGSGQDIWSYYGGLENATLNWWGSNSGPAAGRLMIGGEGTFDAPSSTYTPWLVMNILPADPSTIYTGETSKITVNVYTDSNGVDHSADAAQFFSGPEVTFTTNLGNVGSKTITVPWTLGMAFATLRGDEGPGIATVTAADGSVTLSTTVTILQAPEVNAATVGMQETGLPIAGLILAILAVFGGFASSKRK